MSRTKTFFKTSIVYFVGNILTKIISFFLLPLYTSKLESSEIGYYDLVNSILMMTIPLLCLEIWSGVLRFVIDESNNRIKSKYSYIKTSFVFLSASIVLMLIIGIFLYEMQSPENFLLILFIAVLMIWQNELGIVARSLQKNVAYMMSGLLGSVVTVLLNVLLIGVLNYKGNGLFISAALGLLVQVLVLTISLPIVSIVKIGKVQKDMLIELLQYSLPLCLNSFTFWLLNNYSKVAISNVLDYSAVGIYGIATRFTSVLTLFVSVFTLAWQETAFRISNSEDRIRIYEVGLKHYSRIMLSGFILLVPFTFLVWPYMVKGNYDEALTILPLLYFGAVMNALASYLGGIFGAEKKNKQIFYSTIVAASINVVILHVFLPRNGLLAAAIGNSLGFFIMFLYRCKMLIKNLNFKFEWLSFFSLISLGFVISLIVSTKNTTLIILVFLFAIAVSLLINKNLIHSLYERLFKGD